MMPLQHKVLLFSFCLYSAAQEASKLPDAHESDRKAYDEIYAKNSDMFSALPNAFMIRTIGGRMPGRALDVAMGQGRNALWLASQGWAVTGFDISPVGIEAARKEAEKRGLRIETFVAAYDSRAQVCRSCVQATRPKDSFTVVADGFVVNKLFDLTGHAAHSPSVIIHDQFTTTADGPIKEKSWRTGLR